MRTSGFVGIFEKIVVESLFVETLIVKKVVVETVIVETVIVENERSVFFNLLSCFSTFLIE